MKINTLWATRGNFGDELNAILWPLIFRLNERASTRILTGIGTIITQENKFDCEEIILGAGYDPARGLISLKNRKVYAVRGPKTATCFKLDEKFSTIDPGILLPFAYKSSAEKCGRGAFMPHYTTAKRARATVMRICDSLGLVYVDPLSTPYKVAQKISAAKFLLTEALHGAVAAESYNVPWKALVLSNHVLDFKWIDWCLSIGIDYQPQKFGVLQDAQRYKTTDLIKKKLIDSNIGKAKWANLCPPATPDLEILSIIERLDEVIQKHDFVVGNLATKKQSCQKLINAIYNLSELEKIGMSKEFETYSSPVFS